MAILVVAVFLFKGPESSQNLREQLDYYWYVWSVAPNLKGFNKKTNGLWLGSKWYQGKVTGGDIEGLAKLLNDEQIAYAYFHSRDIDKEGKLRFSCEKTARHFVEILHKLCPHTKILAWIGAVNSQAGGDVDLTNKAVREQMADQAKFLVDHCGYDGVQWDFEPCPESQDFIELLKNTRRTLGGTALLGAAVPPSWNYPYISAVSAHCDQMAIMAYDTGLRSPRAYATKLAELIVYYSQAVKVAGSPCYLIIGVPTYDDNTLAHNRFSECLEVSLVGVKNAMNNPRCCADVILGIAPYAEFTTDGREWRFYEKYWRDCPAPPLPVEAREHFSGQH